MPDLFTDINPVSMVQVHNEVKFQNNEENKN